jgi:hypothetical protein
MLGDWASCLFDGMGAMVGVVVQGVAPARWERSMVGD